MVGRACRAVRGWLADHQVTVYYVALVVYVTAVGGWAYSELAESDSDFCALNAQRVVDKQVQIVQTKEYLSSSAGQEPSGLNMFIRTTSQPRLEAEVASDLKALPPSCDDEYDRLYQAARDKNLLP